MKNILQRQPMIKKSLFLSFFLSDREPVYLGGETGIADRHQRGVCHVANSSAQLHHVVEEVVDVGVAYLGVVEGLAGRGCEGGELQLSVRVCVWRG